jgi:hypothetical protein
MVNGERLLRFPAIMSSFPSAPVAQLDRVYDFGS